MAPAGKLTNQEAQIAALVAGGASNREVAAQLSQRQDRRGHADARLSKARRQLARAAGAAALILVNEPSRASAKTADAG
jgi:FixJ family two-component response regulator